ncbi:dynamin family protein [Methyloversatilis sp. XJ19-49]|uniref:dynamin family protein n=1 Tax=Methyloversatilis sp. XJ19-49 TaxID=2963429 RepID=UPI00211D14C3|nr:dynamin family protein [Methyloversatilis sp. XJ19-49]MCQ9380005.1 dynamin family protein [Methyloversatilis sp. XJ19-49]
MSMQEELSVYGSWRTRVEQTIVRIRGWLFESNLSDAHNDQCIEQLLLKLRDDRLVVAFVAEFSRGKSELINAIFFGDQGARVLPSSSGRTTMCPTELMYDPVRPACIELLPIETRRGTTTVSDLKTQPGAWRRLPLDTTSAASMQQVLGRVSEQRKVAIGEAEQLGFRIDLSGENGLQPDANGMVDVPAWRHAVINMPHPLLRQGLVILDTPGLNAIGAEPELTLSLLPSAHAVLFVLGMDTGVTQSDLSVWKTHVTAAGGSRQGRLAVLNKMDSLWDGLRSEAQIDAEIGRQIESCAATLDLPANRVFPVSAQKGLLARIQRDGTLLARSRLPQLERALVEDLLPAKRDIVGAAVEHDAGGLLARTHDMLIGQKKAVDDQLAEFSDLRGKNRGVIQYMLKRVRAEKEEFERGLERFYATRNVFSSQTNTLFAHLGMDALRTRTAQTREQMEKANFSLQLRDAMNAFFGDVRGSLQQSAVSIDEIFRMMEAMYQRFSSEHDLRLGVPVPFSVQRYEKDITRLEKAFHQQFNTWLNMLTTEKRQLTQRFFETVAVQVRKHMEVVNRDVEHWLRAIMAPLENQVREHQKQLKRRLESVKRIHEATDTLEDRIEELRQNGVAIDHQIEELARLRAALDAALKAAVIREMDAAA